MRRVALLATGLLASCGHFHGADPATAPAPWPAAEAPPPARAAQPPVAAPAPVEPDPPRAAKDREIPSEGRARPFVLPQPERAQLSNGMKVLLVRRTRLPLATVMLVWPNGASSEAVAQAGMASLTAALLTQGAGARSALELAAEIEKLGLRLSASASWDSTTISLTLLTRAIDPALALLSDVVLRPRFDPAEVERLRGEAKTTLLQLADQPATLASLAGARAVYGAEHRYGELVQGSAAALGALTREQIVGWHDCALAPELATVIAVGDLDMKTLRPKLEHALARPAHVRRVETYLQHIVWKNGTAIRINCDGTVHVDDQAIRDFERLKSGPSGVVLVDRPGAAQTEVRLVEPGPPRTTPDYFPLLVLNTIFGGNFSSRLNAKLREEKGYTYGARSDFAFRRAGGPFTAGAPVKTAVTRPALADLRAEIARVSSGEVNDTELRVAKQTLQRSLARSFETPPEVAAALAAIEVYGLPRDYFSTYAAKIEAVSEGDLARAAKALHPEHMTLVVVGDEKVIGAELKTEVGAYEKMELGAK